MRENSNKREVNKHRIKIDDSSASDEADPYPWSIMLGDEMQEGGKIGVEFILRRNWRTGKRFSLTEKLGRVFSSQIWLILRVAEGSKKIGALPIALALRRT